MGSYISQKIDAQEAFSISLPVRNPFEPSDIFFLSFILFTMVLKTYRPCASPAFPEIPNLLHASSASLPPLSRHRLLNLFWNRSPDMISPFLVKVQAQGGRVGTKLFSDPPGSSPMPLDYFSLLFSAYLTVCQFGAPRCRRL